MKALGLYSAAGMGIVVLVTAGAWTFLGDAGRESMLTAALIAWPLQVGFFALLKRAQGEPGRFLMWWAAGILGRMAVVVAAGIVVGRLGGVEPDVLIMSLAGFLFALLLLEPLFLNLREQNPTLAQ